MRSRPTEERPGEQPRRVELAHGEAAQPRFLIAAEATNPGPADRSTEAADDLETAKAMWSEARRLYETAAVSVAVEDCSRHLSMFVSVAREAR